MENDSTGMTDEELSFIKERCESATLGPWVSSVEGRDHTSGSDFIMTGEAENRGEDIELAGATIADQDFIAHARQDIPKLLNEIQRLKNCCRKIDKILRFVTCKLGQAIFDFKVLSSESEPMLKLVLTVPF